MKKKIFLLLLGFTCCLTTQAQTSLGIQASAIKSWSNNYHFSDGNRAPKIGGHGISALLYYSIGKHFQIGMEPGIAQRGYSDATFLFFDIVPPSFSPGINGQNIRSVYSNYIVLPIMAKINAPFAGGKLVFFIKSGIGPSWLVSAYEEGIGVFSSGNPDGAFQRVDFDADPDYERWDIGLYGGAGLEMKAGPCHILLSFDTYTGFNSIGRFDSSKNRSFGFSLGYAVDLN